LKLQQTIVSSFVFMIIQENVQFVPGPVGAGSSDVAWCPAGAVRRHTEYYI